MQIIQGRYLSSYLRNLTTAMEHAVETSPENRISEANHDSYISPLIEKYTVKPIQLHLDRKEVTTHKKNVHARDLSPDVRFGRGINLHDSRPLIQTALTCHLPVSGDATLLEFDPSQSNRLSLPKLTLH